jgi:protein-disulfide isomerase
MTRHSTASLTRAVSEHDHIRGPATAQVTLLEYGDYECPYCGAAYPVVEELCKSLGDRMRFAFRHFPLTQIHPNAMSAAESAEAAGAQGKFWEMHALLYTNQQSLDPESLAQYAAWINLDPKAIAEALSTHEFAGRIRQDFSAGIRSGVNGTPTFFIDNVRYDGTSDFDAMLAAIEAASGHNG